jgi:predicted transcriptional regulator of viral defense system
MAAEQAASLACGSQAVISHRSAAHLWGFAPDRPSTLEVTISERQRRPKQGIHLHRVASIEDRDVRTKSGLRLTSPARTILDLAARVGVAELERLVAEARVRKLLGDGELEAAVARAGNRPGSAKLRAFLHAEGDTALTRSAAERLCRRLLQAAGLPQPKVNHRVAGYEVDFL